MSRAQAFLCLRRHDRMSQAGLLVGEVAGDWVARIRLRGGLPLGAGEALLG